MAKETRMIRWYTKKEQITKLLIGISLVIVFLGIAIMIVGENMYKNVIDIECENNIDRGIEPLFNNKKDIIEKFYTYKSQELSIPSRNGYNINGLYIKAPRPSNQTVILIHELGPNKWENIEWAFMYLKNNYNVVLYNQRGVGGTGGEKKSFGYYEKEDLASVISYIDEKYPSRKLGLHGFGVGAATVTLYCAMDEAEEKVDFFILDSPFDNMKEVMQNEMKNRKVPILLEDIVLWLSDKYLEITQRFGYEDVEPNEAIKNTAIPMLIIHGDEDGTYPIEMGVNLYNNKQKGYKDLWIVEGEGHIEGFKKYPQEYEKRILEFIETSMNRH